MKKLINTLLWVFLISAVVSYITLPHLHGKDLDAMFMVCGGLTAITYLGVTLSILHGMFIRKHSGHSEKSGGNT